MCMTRIYAHKYTYIQKLGMEAHTYNSQTMEKYQDGWAS